MHGGSVRAASMGEAHGSTFQIRLPRIAAPSGVAKETLSSEIVANRILLVDDNVDAAESLRLFLEMRGHTVRAVHCAQDALANLVEFEPGVMLIDIGLPDLDGYELVKRLGEVPLSRDMKKIALTGYGQPEDKLRALQSGFDAHLVKSVVARDRQAPTPERRHRLRAIQLKHWKRGTTMHRELLKLGAAPSVARKVAANSRCWWRNSDRLLKTVLTIGYFDRLGVPRLS